jgi:putative ABC transport system permease protein
MWYGEGSMHGWLNEFRQSLRGLGKTPGFTLLATLTLALGIGINTSMLTAFDRLLFRPLSFRDLDRIVRIYDGNTRLGWTRNSVSPANFLEYERQTTLLVGVAAYRAGNVTLSGDGDPSRIPAARVTRGFLPCLGVVPALGRNFLPEEDRAGGPGAVLLSDAFWRARFAADPRVVGRFLNFDGQPCEVVGVLPPSFHFGGLLGGRITQGVTMGEVGGGQVVLPMAFGPDTGSRFGHNLSVLGRLRTGASVAAADQEFKRIADGLARLRPPGSFDAAGSATVIPVLEAATLANRTHAWLFLSLSGFLLLIACSNVSNLILARGMSRQHELAVRAAMGADRLQLMRQLLSESLLLGLLGGVGGLGLTLGILALLGRLFAALPQFQRVGPDGWVLAYALGASLLAVALSSLVPLWRLSRTPPAALLKEGARGSRGRAHGRFQAAQLAIQVGLSGVLLTGAGLMLRSLWKLQQVPLGLDTRNVLTASLTLPQARYPDKAAWSLFANRLEERLRAVPGVREAGLASCLPPLTSSGNQSGGVLGEPDPPAGRPQLWNIQVTPGYFATVRLHALQGAFSRRPTQDTCVVNQALINLYGLRGGVVGRQVQLGSAPPLTILAVVGDVRNRGLDQEPGPQVYTFMQPTANTLPSTFVLHLRAEAAPWTLLGPLRTALQELDPNLALAQVQTMDEATGAALRGQRTTATLFVGFGILGLLLAASGLYGLLSYSVAQRTREMGVRQALGATTSALVLLVLRQSLLLTALGLGVGLGVCLALGRLMASLLYGVQPLDGVTLVAASATLLLVSALAAWLPSLRAATVAPAVALRSE